MLWLDVTVTQTPFVHVLDGAKQLQQKVGCLLLCMTLSIQDCIKKPTTTGILQNLIEIAIVNEAFLQFDDAGMRTTLVKHNGLLSNQLRGTIVLGASITLPEVMLLARHEFFRFLVRDQANDHHGSLGEHVVREEIQVGHVQIIQNTIKMNCRYSIFQSLRIGQISRFCQ